jgi:hypothetical protein
MDYPVEFDWQETHLVLKDLFSNITQSVNHPQDIRFMNHSEIDHPSALDASIKWHMSIAIFSKQNKPYLFRNCPQCNPANRCRSIHQQDCYRFHYCRGEGHIHLRLEVMINIWSEYNFDFVISCKQVRLFYKYKSDYLGHIVYIDALI